jgi:hypothetical protein
MTFDFEATVIASQSRLPEHLVALSGEQWALWRCVGLRGAGFPVIGVLKLAASECARIADDLIRAEEQAEQSWKVALDALSREMDEAEPGKLGSLERAMKQLKKGQPTQLLEDCDARQQIERFAADCEKADAISEEFYSSFESALENISGSIKEIVRLEAFREAITWQNRNALHRGMDLLLESAASRRSSHRKSEELVANYWQRYCTKNDTIGFFGPMGWASFNAGPNPINIRHGNSLVARRNAYFESWCIDVLAEKLADNKLLQPWIAPRRSPFIHIDGMMLQLADGSATPLCTEEAALLKLCDGTRTAKEIAEQLLESGISKLTSVDDVYLWLGSLSEREIVSWTFQAPLVKHPQLALRKLIERIEDDDLRAQPLEVLSGLESAFERVAASAGDSQRLDRSLEELETFFINATGTAATKDHGKTYAGRMLVFEDCVRDAEVDIGPQLLESLSQPLLLLLTSARWLVSEFIKEYRTRLEQIYGDLARQTGNSSVPAPIFWARAQALLFGSNRRSIDHCLRDFQRKWAEVISIPADGAQLHYTSDELKARIVSAFAVDASYRNYFRYHSPDIMIAAPSVEAICRDDYLFVMGELHLGLNTLSQSLFVNQHPEPEKISEAIDLDLPEPRLVPVLPKFMCTAISRSRLLRPSPKDFFLELALDSPSPSSENTLLIGDLIIDDKGAGPFVSTRDGKLQFDIIQTFTEPLTGLIMNCFKILPPMRHSPRITIDRLVVCRESWAFSPLDLEFAFESDESFRFINARRWARNNHLPRFIYFKSSVEDKPCFVDLDSPIYINTFAKVIRRTAENSRSQGVDASQQLISVTEMLPNPDQTWLTDAQGNRYTSEFRIIALDRS